jgi:surface antigen
MKLKPFFLTILLLAVPTAGLAATTITPSNACLKPENGNQHHLAACALYQTTQQLQSSLGAVTGDAAGLKTKVAATKAKVAALQSQAQAQTQAYADNDALMKNREERITKLETDADAKDHGGACDNGHGNGGYPMALCNAPQDSVVDSWGMYNRESVSWTAWRRSAIGRPVPGFWGNANQWDDRARATGYRVDALPEVGAVAISNFGPWGHAAIVEQIIGDSVIVSEMNYDGSGHYRLSTYGKGFFVYIHDKQTP